MRASITGTWLFHFDVSSIVLWGVVIGFGKLIEIFGVIVKRVIVFVVVVAVRSIVPVVCFKLRFVVVQHSVNCIIIRLIVI